MGVKVLKQQLKELQRRLIDGNIIDERINVIIWLQVWEKVKFFPETVALITS